VLGLMYLIFSAKPISIRRLSLLFVFSLVSTRCLLATLHPGPAAILAPHIATLATLAVWSYPLLKVVHSACRGRIGLESFERVSICVQATYGFAAAIAFAAGVRAFVAPFDPLTFAALSRTVAVALAFGMGFAIVIPMLRRMLRESVTREGSVHHASSRDCLPSNSWASPASCRRWLLFANKSE
jgi:hypothetical protein